MLKNISDNKEKYFSPELILSRKLRILKEKFGDKVAKRLSKK